jgi:hypothetical protein
VVRGRAITSTERYAHIRHTFFAFCLYELDFLVRLRTSGLNLLLEIRGYEVHNPGLNEAKHGVAQRWVTAVNNLGEFGRWDLLVYRELANLNTSLEQLATPPPTSIGAREL